MPADEPIPEEILRAFAIAVSAHSFRGHDFADLDLLTQQADRIVEYVQTGKTPKGKSR